MPKLYVISDVHGYFDLMKKALDEAGFDPNNEEHHLVVCGDCFDRGDQPVEVMRYLIRLPRKTLIFGNHEELFRDCCSRGYAYSHDYSNGTFDTICELGGAGEGLPFDECCIRAENRTRHFLDQFVNYLETEHYIFVHSWIPLTRKDDFPAWYTKDRIFEYNPDWRNASDEEWESATWGNPFDLAARGLNQTGKIIVFGHFHTSWPRCHYEGKPEWGSGADFSPYYGKNYIAIDACTAYSGRVNVLVLEDDLLEE